MTLTLVLAGDHLPSRLAILGWQRTGQVLTAMQVVREVLAVALVVRALAEWARALRWAPAGDPAPIGAKRATGRPVDK